MIIVFYSMLDRDVPRASRTQWLAELPDEKRRALSRLRRSEDRLRSLVGYQLLKKACQTAGLARFRLEALNFSPDGKPYLHGDMHFSLSHSHRLVACAVSRCSRIGLDTEYVRPIDGVRLANTLTEAERRSISSDPRTFFRIWTQKEATIKAQGNAGLQHMREIDFCNAPADRSVCFRGRQWYLADVPLAEDYVTHVSALQPSMRIMRHKIPLSQLY